MLSRGILHWRVHWDEGISKADEDKEPPVGREGLFSALLVRVLSTCENTVKHLPSGTCTGGEGVRSGLAGWLAWTQTVMSALETGEP